MRNRINPDKIRLDVINFCEQYLKKYPKQSLFHRNQEYIGMCLNKLKFMKYPDSYDLAITLAEINEKIIKFDGSKIFCPMGSFRLKLEDSLRSLMELPSYKDSIIVVCKGEYDEDIPPPDTTRYVIEQYFKERTKELKELVNKSHF